MKNNIKYFTVALCIMLFYNIKSQGLGEWTWMNGSNTPNPVGSFGTKGVAAASNHPPGLYEGYEWTDLNGNFWLFGGVDNVSFAPSEHNALWKFDPLTNQWTWMKGSSTSLSAGVYGVQGVPASTNEPGARGWGGVSWVDNSGDLWLFGGYGHDATGFTGALNDLWRYNIASNQWTWMKGSNAVNGPVVTGTKGVAAMANTPDGRQETNGGVADALGNLWLFGGANNFGSSYNDVWKYNIASNMWTWVAGNQLLGNSPNYGTINVSSPTNDPGDRFCYTKFIDSQNNLYFLGAGLTGFGGSNVCDVWKFSPTSSEWTWVGGSNTLDPPGSYINKCDTVTLNSPNGKYEIRASWSDSCGFFFFGGFGGTTFGSYNDLWYYNIETNKFNWISGTSLADNLGSYGTIGVSAASNMPCARGGALAFKDKQSNLWLFGGATTSFGGFDKLNDLWRFKLDPNCGKLCSKSVFNSALTANFSANTICGNAPLTAQFTNSSISATTYTWNFGDGSPLNNSSNPAHTYTANGTYNVSLTAQGTGTNTAIVVKNAYIYIGNLPTASFTTLANDTLCLSSTFNFNNTSQDSIASSLWNFGDGQSSATSNTFHQYLLPGSYTISLIVKDNHNCVDTATQKVVVLAGPTALFTKTPTTGCQPLSVAFTNNSINAVSYLWDFGDLQTSINSSSNINHLYTSSGGFTVSLIATNSIGCTDTAKSNVIIYQKPDASFTTTGYDGCFPYSSIAFANTTGLSGYEWLINGISASINDSLSLGTIDNVSTKEIALITINSFGCKDTVVVTKKFTDDNCSNLYIPNVFTPNGDLANNLFEVKALNYNSYHIVIYDRWGLKMFESSDPTVHWNGKPNNSGTECPEGTYFYILNLTDRNDTKTDYKGFLNLFR